MGRKARPKPIGSKCRVFASFCLSALSRLAKTRVFSSFFQLTLLLSSKKPSFFFFFRLCCTIFAFALLSFAFFRIILTLFSPYFAPGLKPIGSKCRFFASFCFSALSRLAQTRVFSSFFQPTLLLSSKQPAFFFFPTMLHIFLHPLCSFLLYFYII